MELKTTFAGLKPSEIEAYLDLIIDHTNGAARRSALHAIPWWVQKSESIAPPASGAFTAFATYPL